MKQKFNFLVGLHKSKMNCFPIFCNKSTIPTVTHSGVIMIVWSVSAPSGPGGHDIDGVTNLPENQHGQYPPSVQGSVSAE